MALAGQRQRRKADGVARKPPATRKIWRVVQESAGAARKPPATRKIWRQHWQELMRSYSRMKKCKKRKFCVVRERLQSICNEPMEAYLSVFPGRNSMHLKQANISAIRSTQNLNFLLISPKKLARKRCALHFWFPNRSFRNDRHCLCAFKTQRPLKHTGVFHETRLQILRFPKLKRRLRRNFLPRYLSASCLYALAQAACQVYD